MSADNWAICPRCIDAERTRFDALVVKAAEGYGTLPVEEFDAIRAEVAAGVDTDKFQTFREDYEFYGAEDGTIEVAYSGHCSKCGLDFSFKDSRPFWPEPTLGG